MDNNINCKIKTRNKLINSIDELFNKIKLKNGMTVSFHHHLRNGDYVLNMVLKELAKRGIKDITVAMSSIFPVHAPMVEYIKDETITKIVTSYMSGPVAEAVSYGYLKNPAIMQTHGGRARAIESGELHIDVAFIAAPTADAFGNSNGVYGKAACGALGYAVADSQYADVVVVITDNLVNYPACPIEISETNVDYVVKVNSIGDAAGIVSGTTKITKEPVGLIIAKTAAKVIEASGLVENGMSFQTGAGGISLAVASELRKIMIKRRVTGSFASGGITEYLVNMLDEGLFENLFDVQCFDLKAVESYRDNPKHQPMSASQYGNPGKKGCVSEKLDVMILGASEMDLDFNVNVTTGSDGVIMGGSGGHSDTAAGAKLSVVVTNLIKGRLPIIKDRVTTITTPGKSIDVVVTERGIAVNPLRKELEGKLKNAGLNVLSINELKNLAEKMTGKPKPIKTGPKVVAVVEYRDGSIIDKVYQIID